MDDDVYCTPIAAVVYITSVPIPRFNTLPGPTVSILYFKLFFEVAESPRSSLDLAEPMMTMTFTSTEIDKHYLPYIIYKNSIIPP